MEEKAEVFVITEQSLQDKIYYVRGHKVMLDFDLAAIYRYTTKAFNQQVKNNPNLILTKYLKSQFVL